MRKNSLILLFVSIYILCISFIPLVAGTKQSHMVKKNNAASARKYAKVKEIRYWSGSTHTRIVIDLDREVYYKEQLLKGDIELQKSPRLLIDLKAAKLSSDLKEPIFLNAGILKRVRFGQYTLETVRIVLDLENITDYKIFPLNNPFRVVVDVMGGPSTTAKSVEEPRVSPPSSRPEQLTSFKVILDPGHGGEDPGAMGSSRLKEKDVVLALAKKVREDIKKELKWNVKMTRDDDRFIRLEDRTAIASMENGDLFISIHVNAAKDKRIAGIETYVLGTTTNAVALRLAAKENNISPQKVSDLQIILADLKLNDPAKMTGSRQLAECVQIAMINHLQKKYGQIKDLGVKQAPFVVLVGAEMPSILVEVSFISNHKEEKLLRDERYLADAAEAIVEGLKKFAHGTKAINQPSSISNTISFSSN
jgi:N-acetylmuramoyl-L-alanine amidase